MVVRFAAQRAGVTGEHSGFFYDALWCGRHSVGWLAPLTQPSNPNP